jgi:MFS transporter, putative metabolite:H+ symporter
MGVDCTGDFFRKKAIEKTILRILRPSAFLHSLELFPTTIRMRGAGFCNTLGRFMTILTPQITTMLFGLAGVIAVLGYVVGLLLLQVIVVLLFGIETKQIPLETLSEAMIARTKTDATASSVGTETRVAS